MKLYKLLSVSQVNGRAVLKLGNNPTILGQAGMGWARSSGFRLRFLLVFAKLPAALESLRARANWDLEFLKLRLSDCRFQTVGSPGPRSPNPAGLTASWTSFGPSLRFASAAWLSGKFLTEGQEGCGASRG